MVGARQLKNMWAILVVCTGVTIAGVLLIQKKGTKWIGALLLPLPWALLLLSILVFLCCFNSCESRAVHGEGSTTLGPLNRSGENVTDIAAAAVDDDDVEKGVVSGNEEAVV